MKTAKGWAAAGDINVFILVMLSFWAMAEGTGIFGVLPQPVQLFLCGIMWD